MASKQVPLKLIFSEENFRFFKIIWIFFMIRLMWKVEQIENHAQDIVMENILLYS